MKLSAIYDMDIYSDEGQFLGNVKDAIVDLEHGEVGRLMMENWDKVGRGNIQQVLKDKSVLFKNIKNIGDVVLVSVTRTGSSEPIDTSDLSFK